MQGDPARDPPASAPPPVFLTAAGTRTTLERGVPRLSGARKGNVKPRIAVIILLLAALPAASVAAQDQVPVKAAVFTIRDLGPSPDAEFDLLLSESVRIEIENAGYEVVEGWNALLSPEEKPPVHGPRAAELARGVGAALAVTGYYTRPDTGSVALAVQCWDAEGETLLASFIITAPFDLSYYNLLHDRLVALVAAAEEFTGPPRIEAIEVAAARGLGAISFLSAQDGVEVLLAGEKSLGAVAGGRLEAPVGLLSAGSRLELELRKDGFHTLETAVTAIPEVRLPALLPAHRWTVEVLWNNGQPLGVGGKLHWFPVPDWVYVGGIAQLSAQVPSSGSTGEYVVLHADAGARAGLYLLPQRPQVRLFGTVVNIPLRVGVEAGFGALPSLSLAPAFPFWLDWYVALPQPFVEFGTKETVVTFRIDQRYALGFPGGVLDRGWIMRRVYDTTDPYKYNDQVPVSLGVTFKW